MQNNAGLYLNSSISRRSNDVVAVLHCDTLRLLAGQLALVYRMFVIWETYHLINLIHTNQARRKLEHVVP